MRVEVQHAPSVPAERKEKKPRRRISPFKLIKRLLLLCILAALITAVVIVVNIPKRFNLLVIGSDQRSEERGRSDVLMVLSLTKSPKDPITILTIPRDTRVEVPGFGTQKITHAYALGDSPADGKDLGNHVLTTATVEQFLGIPIDGTVEVTFASFEELIDKLGGVVTKNAGELDGKKALAIVRDRSREGGDFARTADQREIVMAVFRKVKLENRFQEVYTFLQQSAESRIEVPKTRFALFSVYALVRRAGLLRLDDAHTDVVPGKGAMLYTEEFQQELYYWVPDRAKTDALVREWLS